MAGIPLNPQELVQLLQKYCRDGTKTHGNTGGMEFIAAGNLQDVFGKLATIWFVHGLKS